MFVKIYGRNSCPFCMRAKNLAQKLKDSISNFDYEYIDMIEHGLTKEDLIPLVGRPVQTVPQIFIDGKSIGGCSDFQALMKDLYSWCGVCAHWKG